MDLVGLAGLLISRNCDSIFRVVRTNFLASHVHITGWGILTFRHLISNNLTKIKSKLKRLMMLQFQDRCLAVESEIDKPLRTPAQCYRKFWDSVDNILRSYI